MNETPRNNPDMISLYLDDMMSQDERRDFEQRLKADEKLRVELEAARRIELALRDSFSPPAIPMPTRSPVGPASFKFPAGKWPLALAAAIAVVAAVGYYVAQPSQPPTKWIGPEVVYNNLISGGFRPTFVCTTEPEFAAAVETRFGQPLVVATSPGVDLLGWAYGAGYSGTTLSEKTLILMATVEEEKIIVLMDQASKDRQLSVPPESGLKLHRQQFGEMILYEVSTSANPRLLPLTFNPKTDPRPEPARLPAPAP